MGELELDPADLPPREPIEYLEIPFRRPFAFLVPFLIVLAIAAVAYVVAPRLFTSSTLIMIEGNRLPDAFGGGKVVEDSGRRLRLMKPQVLSRTRLERVIKELDPYPQLDGESTSGELVERMRNAIDVKIRGSDGFYIEYVHTNPYLAMAVTNRLSTLFIEETGQSREQFISSALQFIDARLAEAKRALEENEAALRTIRMKHLGSLPEEMLSNIGSMQRFQLELQTLSESMRASEDRRAVLEKQLAEALKQVGEARPGGRTISESEAEAKRLNQQLAELASRYTDEHPEVRRLRGRITRVEEQIESARSTETSPDAPVLDPALAPLRAQLNQVTLDVATLRRKKDNLEQRIAALDAAVAQTPQVEQELLALTRDYRKLSESYASMLSKKADTEMTDKLEREFKGERYRVLDPAYLPEKPSSPIRWKFLFGGLALAVAAGLGTAGLAEWLDHSIKNPRELEALLPFPHLVTVPHISLWRLRLKGRRRLAGSPDSRAVGARGRRAR